MNRKLLAVPVLVAALFVPAAGSSATAGDGDLVLSDSKTAQIYRIGQDGSQLTQLTHVPAGQFALAPRWSPDRRHIAFVIAADNLDRMYTMDRDGGHVHLVRTDTADWNNDVPAYFPDGQHLVFARCHTDGAGCGVATVRADGTGLRTLTDAGFEAYDFDPDVSPDGRRIAFTRLNADGIHSQVWLMNADGTGAHPITRPVLEARVPRWSPDGSNLLVASNCCRLGGDEYRISPSGRHLARLTRTAWPNYSGPGVYSPSSRSIAFVSDRAFPDKSGVELYLMRADGSHEVKVDTGLTGVETVDWGRAAT
jgi:Tol biopolymer transport system component